MYPLKQSEHTRHASSFSRFDSHATHACPLQPAALVFVSYGFVLVRVRVRVRVLICRYMLDIFCYRLHRKEAEFDQPGPLNEAAVAINEASVNEASFTARSQQVLSTLKESAVAF